MRILDMFVIICIIAVGMFGLIFISGNATSPLNVKDTFGNTPIPSHVVINNDSMNYTAVDKTHVSINYTNMSDPNATIDLEDYAIINNTYMQSTNTSHPTTYIQYDLVANDSNNSYMASYNSLQNTTAFEVQGAGAGIVILAACVVMIIIFAFIVLSRGKYSKNRYRT